jgi:predicted metal-dependent HD superfamily phosphohydrolase
MTNNIYKLTEEHVRNLFEMHKRPNLVFHSIEHTQRIVKRVEEIEAHYNLNEKEKIAVYIAAWFHDTGYLFTSPAGHEEKSVEQMKSFMEKNLPDGELIQTVQGCIMATKMGEEPSTPLQQILCDADTYHLGTKDFKKTNKQVRKELEAECDISKTEWNVKTLEFLERHKYYTSYCIDLLSKGKQENIETLRRKIAEQAIGNDSNLFNAKEKDDQSKLDKQTNNLLSKGIQTMLRTASSNHLRLSYMADRKANILISVNAIIISVSISVLLRRFEESPFLVTPTIIFLAFSVVTIVLSIIATRPTITSGKFSKEDITNKKVNLLFFGNFYKATLADYNWGMSIMMRDPDYLYGSLIKDVYYLGVVLARKYKLLRLAYNIFMVGIVISVIAFTIAVFTRSPESAPVITPSHSSPL